MAMNSIREGSQPASAEQLPKNSSSQREPVSGWKIATAGETSVSPDAAASACSPGHSAAALDGLSCDWCGPSGSLKPRR